MPSESEQTASKQHPAADPSTLVDPTETTTPPLPHLVWQNILHYLRRRSPDAEESALGTDFPPGQRDVARMMRVNSSLHDMAGPILYHTVITQDLGKLLAGLLIQGRETYLEGLKETCVKLHAIKIQRSRIEGRKGSCKGNCSVCPQAGTPAPVPSQDYWDLLTQMDAQQLDDLASPLEERLDHLHQYVVDENLRRPAPRQMVPSPRARLSKLQLLSFAKRLQLICPRDLRCPTDVVERGDDYWRRREEFMERSILQRMGYVFDQYQAMMYLSRNPNPLPRLEHINLGMEGARELDSLYDFHGLTSRLETVQVETGSLLLSYILRNGVSMVCESGTEPFIPLAFPPRAQRQDFPSGGFPASNSLSLFTTHCIRESWLVPSGLTSIGIRRRVHFYARDYKPIPCMCLPTSEAPLVIAKIRETVTDLTQSLTVMPEGTGVEVILHPPRIPDSRSSPETVERELLELLEEAQEALEKLMLRNGLTNWEENFRVITDVSQSPWGECGCTDW